MNVHLEKPKPKFDSCLTADTKIFPTRRGDTEKNFKTVRENTRELGRGGRDLLNMRGNPKTFQETPQTKPSTDKSHGQGSLAGYSPWGLKSWFGHD